MRCFCLESVRATSIMTLLRTQHKLGPNDFWVLISTLTERKILLFGDLGLALGLSFRAALMSRLFRRRVLLEIYPFPATMTATERRTSRYGARVPGLGL